MSFVRRIFQYAVMLLAGCSLVYDPLNFECIPQPFVIETPGWSVESRSVLLERLDYYHLDPVESLGAARFEIVLGLIEHEAIPQWVDTVNHRFYRNYVSRMNARCVDRLTGELVFDHMIEATQTLKTDPHVYLSNQMNLAELHWSQQIMIYEQLIREIKKLCDMTPSGQKNGEISSQ